MESVFFRAVKEGDEGEVARLLDEDPALLEKAGHEGFTPFLLAAMHGQLGVMQLLIGRGADTSATTRISGNTALHMAAWGGQEQAAAFLLGQGAQSTHRKADAMTPFMLASGRGHLGVVRLLLHHLGKQELQVTSKAGQTGLHWAALGGKEEIVSFLLGQGAQANSRDKNGATPFIMACVAGCVDAVRMLYQHAGPQALQETDNEGKTPLHFAADRGHGETVTFLISEGAEANSKDNGGRTSLLWASHKGRTGVVQMLVQHMGKQAVQETDNNGVTALHLAAIGGHEETAAFLISKGAECSSRTAEELTPLMLACWEGRLGAVRLLLQHMGPEALQERNRNGGTAIHCACVKGHGAVVRVLLIGGADPTVTDHEGRTPRAIAEEEGEGDNEDERRRRAGCVASFEVRRSHVVAHTSVVRPAYIPSPEMC
jgi:serine/threonine-protein phosphatase 6 regulatory ankyrin repeat subunit B